MECGMERRFHRGFTAAEKTEPKHVSLPAAAAALPSASDSGAAAAIDTNAVVTAPASRSALRVPIVDRENPISNAAHWLIIALDRRLIVQAAYA